VTSAEFKALKPQFSAASYDDRITALLLNIEQLDEAKVAEAGLSLNLVLSEWLAGELADQDFAIIYGAGASLGSSSTVEKRVGEVAIKRSTAQSSSSAGGSPTTGNRHKDKYNAYLRQIGMGAKSV